LFINNQLSLEKYIMLLVGWLVVEARKRLMRLSALVLAIKDGLAKIQA
jgi:hypothetical protein